jgi:hypothetical protein
MDAQRVRSLELVERVVRDERAAQLDHFDALDMKAGVILGFAGAIIALSSPAATATTIVGKALAIVSAGFTIGTFWPRRFWTMDVLALRDGYLAADPAFTRLRILDTMIATARENDRTLALRGRTLKAAMVALAVAAVLIGTGSWLD